MSAIEIRDLAVSLGDTRILTGITAAVGEGTFVGLVGPNGAGKSTLLRTINGILGPDAGTVRVDGEDVHDLPAAAVSRRIATVPQDTSLSFDFDVREVVAMGRTPHRSRFGSPTAADRERVEAALDRTETAEFADRPITAVSGGERQRVVLARALAQDAPVLLLDEPTASLDIHHQVRTLELVRELVNEGRTVLAAIHDLNLAAHYCDELLLLSAGRVLATGTPEGVLSEANLREAFGTRAVVSRHPVTGSVYVTALPERRTATRDARVHVVGGGGTVSRLLYVLSSAGYEVSVGVLNEGDSDLETARDLGLETAVEEPFAPVGEEALAAASDLVRRADAVVVGDVEVGVGNLPNLEVAGEADHLVVVEERPFGERNYAGEAGRRRYEELRDRAALAGPDDLLAAVDDAVAAVRGESAE